MTLWTVQPYRVYELLQKDGIFISNPDLSPNLDCSTFINAYHWLIRQMKMRIGVPSNPNIKTPIWAWYFIEGKNAKPDMRKSYLKVSKKSVLLEIEIPDTEVLLTDYTDWHIALNNSIYYKANLIHNISDEEWYKEVEKEDKYSNSLSPQKYIEYKEKSWENIIVSKDTLSKFVQATFWELKKENIKKVWILKK